MFQRLIAIIREISVQIYIYINKYRHFVYVFIIIVHVGLLLFHIPLYLRLDDDGDLSLKRVWRCKLMYNVQFSSVHVLVLSSSEAVRQYHCWNT